VHRKFTFPIACTVAMLLFLVFCLVHHHKTQTRIARRVQEHGRIVAHAVWNLNEKTSAEYLRLAALHNNYKTIAVLDTNGTVFVRASVPLQSRLDAVLTSLHLIPEQLFAAPIDYQDHRIGRIEVVWRNTTVYVIFFALLITVLLLSTIYMYLRLLDSNRNLEREVRSRTRTLQESEQKFRALFDNHYQLTGLISPDGILLSANQAALDLAGCSEKDIVGLPFCQCPWWPETSPLHDRVKKAVQEAQAGNFVRLELQFRDRDGHDRVVDFSLKPVFNRQNELIYIVPEGRDITDLKQARREKIREQMFTEAVVESLPGIFYICNEKLELIRWNKSFETTSGYSAEELRGRSLFSFFADEDQALIRQRIEERKKQVVDAPLELYALAKNGARIPFLFSSSIFTVDGTTYLIGTGVDISDRKKIEQELQQARKMEAIGTLAGGIAHDFNNILSAIIGYTELSRLETDPASRLGGFLDGIHQAAIRARDLVQQILIFSRKQDNSLVPMQVAPVVHEALRLIRSSLPSTITIRTRIDAKNAMILADPTRIHQVTVNLCTNAYQAIDEGPGTMEVTLDTIVLDTGGRIRGKGLPPGGYVRLQVRDDGPGMNEETLQRIFEPYFTTKETGKGTGLGLALVDSIVKEHRGAVTVESKSGSGTAFTVYLPLLDQSEDKQLTTEPASSPQPAGGHHVVCVDDEPYILNILREFLRDRGYRVTIFENSEQALAFMEKNERRVDLVITDMTMPGLTGLELGRKIFADHPDVPVILCTGYSPQINREQALAEGFAAYLDKPIILAELAAAMQQALAGSDEPR
jgi:PAS domain S-box-containing protein